MKVVFQKPLKISTKRIAMNYKEQEFNFFTKNEEILYIHNPERKITFKMTSDDGYYLGIDTDCTEDELSEAFKKLPLEELGPLVSALNQAGIKLQKLFLLSITEDCNDFHERVKLFIDNHYDVNEVTSSKINPPLFQAIKKNDSLSVHALLTHGANANTIINDQSALLMAAEKGNAVMVSDLLMHGAKPDFKTSDGWTPLAFAVKNGNLDMVNMLFSYQSDYDMEVGGDSILLFAIHNEKVDILNTLLTHKADVNYQRKKDGVTPLYFAAQDGKLDCISKLLEFKASPNIALHGKITPLMAACEYNHIGVMIDLLGHNANINDVDKYGQSALHRAAHHGHRGIVTYLLSKKANPDERNNLGLTPLFMAVKEGHEDIVKMLVKVANVNQTFRGMSLLFRAVSLNNKEMVEDLLAAKADPNKGFLDKTPLEEAEKRGFTEIVSLLKSTQSVPNPIKNIPIVKKEQVIDIPLIESWRLFTDGILQKKDNGWVGFEEREPGYLQGIGKAMAFAMEHLDDELNIKFIQNIHKLAMEGVANTNYSKNNELPGEIRRTEVSYGLCQENVTKKGFAEILKKSMQEERHLTITFYNLSPELKSIIFQTLDHISDEALDIVIDKMYEQIQNCKLVKISGQFPMASMSNDITKCITAFIEKYEYEINMAKDDQEEKMKAILSFVKSCEHMHVFIDGNGRTLYMIMLYYLFIKNNLPVPVLKDINDLTGHSMDELIVLIKEGWKNKTRLNDPTNDLFGISTKDILDILTYEKLQYFITALKPLKPFFEASPLYQLLEAIIEKQADIVNNLVENNDFLLKKAYSIFLSLVELPTAERLIDFKNHFPALFHKFIHSEELAKSLESAVVRAAKHDRAETLELLIKEGAPLQKNNKDDILYIAVLNNSFKVLNLLLDPKFKSTVNLDVPNSSGSTAAMYAAYLSMFDALKLLVEGGADLTKGEDKIIGTPLYAAVSTKSLEAVKFLTQPKYNIDINKGNYYKETPLFLAAKYNCGDIFKHLIDCRADLTITDEVDKYAPIHIAAKNGSESVLSIIDDLVRDKHYPIDINQTDKKGNTAVNVAVKYGNINALRILKNIGVNVQKPNDAGVTPLMRAIKNKDMECAKFLIPFSDCNAVSVKGYTAAYYAKKENNTELLELLAKAGADCNLSNLDKFTKGNERLPVTTMIMQNSSIFKKLEDNSLIENHHCSFEQQEDHNTKVKSWCAMQ